MHQNIIQESESTWDMSAYVDTVNANPVFGGETKHCEEAFGASAFSNTLEKSPSDNNGWSYFADVPEKFGFISNTTDSTLSFDVAPQKGTRDELIVHYLRSYSPEWGTAKIKVSGENMSPQMWVIDSHTDEQASQMDEFKVDLGTDTPPFTVTIKNLEGKVKILELFVFSCDPSVDNGNGKGNGNDNSNCGGKCNGNGNGNGNTKVT